jgi:hypothetical protein
MGLRDLKNLPQATPELIGKEAEAFLKKVDENVSRKSVILVPKLPHGGKRMNIPRVMFYIQATISAVAFGLGWDMRWWMFTGIWAVIWLGMWIKDCVERKE